ncbi:hypothetical protein LXJ15735_28600 [Lacrimispora xylanolytica]
MGIDLTTLAAGKSYTDKVAEEIITSDQKENIQKLTSGGEGNKALFDDGTYKTVSGSASDYESLYNRPVINGVELLGNKTPEQLGFSNAAISGSYNDLKDKPEIPTLISQLTNDSDFISVSVSNLKNYYSKMESYSKAEINSLIANLNSMTIEVIEILPSENISITTMYLQKQADKNSYFQWLYINNEWANIGTTDIDLTNYYTKTESDSLFNNKVDKVSGYGLSQNNFTTAEKTKLSGLNNYTLPTATPSALGGVKPDNSTTFVDSNGVLSAVGGASGVIDDNVTSSSKTWSSSKILEGINAVGEIADDISIAQKTVNTRGTKELLNSELSYNVSNASSNGTAISTTINQNINLNESISNYNVINFQIGIKTTARIFKSSVNEFNVSQIVYNNTDTINYSDGSVIYISFDASTNGAGAYGSSHFVMTGWFKTNSIFFVSSFANPTIDINYNKFSIFSIKGINIENVTIDPVNYVNTTQGIEDTPVGHILSQMGKVAPKHYLNCDGATYNITDYPYLSQYIKDQFGTFNFFGGNGTTTFAVPDLRNEFLRGCHGTKTEQLSGEVGVHQEPTAHINFLVDSSSHIYMDSEYGKYQSNSNIDKLIPSTVARGWTNNGNVTNWAGGGNRSFTSRPTNTAVLYCIKYEPTYFMNLSGILENVTLWEGSIGTTGTTNVNDFINLSDQFTNYDSLGIYFEYRNTVLKTRPQYREVPISQLQGIINSSLTAISLSFTWNGTSNDYTDIQKTSTTTRLDLSHSQSFLTKVVGIKYKTSQSADVSYTNQEIIDMAEGVYYGN